MSRSASRVRAIDGLPEDAAIDARIRDLEQRVARLEHRPGPTPDDAAMLWAVGRIAGDRNFLAVEIIARARLDLELAAALRAAHCATARQLGKRLRRLDGVDVAGCTVLRLGGCDRHGVLWRVCTVANPHRD